MKTVGIIDYYLSEWHANNYPRWFARVNEAMGLDYKITYAWAERDVSPVDGRTTQQWCEEVGATPCETVQELCEKSDVLMILAPSDPQTHLVFAQAALPYGKPTFIDKTFAQDRATAKQILDLAAKYGTPMFSTSSLRYATELEDYPDSDGLIITAGGEDFEEEIIHSIEMAVVLLEDPARAVKVERIGSQYFCRIETKSGKNAAILFAPNMEFSVSSERAWRRVKSHFFENMMGVILQFYEDRQLPFDPAQTLEAMGLRDALLAAQRQEGQWITV